MGKKKLIGVAVLWISNKINTNRKDDSQFNNVMEPVKDNNTSESRLITVKDNNLSFTYFPIFHKYQVWLVPIGYRTSCGNFPKIDFSIYYHIIFLFYFIDVRELVMDITNSYNIIENICRRGIMCFGFLNRKSLLHRLKPNLANATDIK